MKIKAIARYTVNCGHKAFEQAMSQHMKGVKFHEVAWRDTENYGDDSDPDFYSTFSWPNKRHPELTKDLFFKMAFSALAVQENCYAKAFYMEFSTENDAVRITDGHQFDRRDEYPAQCMINDASLNDELSRRMKQIRDIAIWGEE